MPNATEELPEREDMMLTPHELRIIHDRVEQYARTDNGLWLNNLNYRNIPLVWSKRMATYDEGSVLGSYAWYTGKIKLQWNNSLEHPENGCQDTWCKLMASTLVHELYHVKQFRKNPIVYILALVLTPFGARERCLEVNARKQGELAEELFNQLGY